MSAGWSTIRNCISSHRAWRGWGRPLRALLCALVMLQAFATAISQDCTAPVSDAVASQLADSSADAVVASESPAHHHHQPSDEDRSGSRTTSDCTDMARCMMQIVVPSAVPLGEASPATYQLNVASTVQLASVSVSPDTPPPRA